MKKITLLLLLSFFISNFSAQNWCPPGATWYYKEYNGVTSTDGVIKYQYVRDTLINSINAKLIKGVFTGKQVGAYPYPIGIINNYGTYITYEANRVVYLYKNGNFDTVVNYNATVGDKWKCLRSSGGCGPARYLTVTDTGHLMVNGLNLKTLVMYDTNKIFATPKIHKTTAIEKVYNFSGGYAPEVLFRVYCDPQENGAYEFSTITFLCYSDDNFSPYGASANACNITGLNETSAGLSELIVYPNPTNSNLKVLLPFRMNSSMEFSLTNNLGQKLLIEKPQAISGLEVELDLTKLAPGIYFIQILDHKKLIAKTKVIKE